MLYHDNKWVGGIDCSTPGFPVYHQLLELTQTHVPLVMPSNHPLLSPSPPAFNLSQHQGLLKWVSSLHQVAKVLEFQLHRQSFQWSPRTPLGWMVGSPCSPRDSQESSLTPQFKSRDITLSTKVRLVKAMVFPMVMYGCESWTIKKAERWRIDAFELWC